MSSKPVISTCSKQVLKDNKRRAATKFNTLLCNTRITQLKGEASNLVACVTKADWQGDGS